MKILEEAKIEEIDIQKNADSCEVRASFFWFGKLTHNDAPLVTESHSFFGLW